MPWDHSLARTFDLFFGPKRENSLWENECCPQSRPPGADHWERGRDPRQSARVGEQRSPHLASPSGLRSVPGGGLLRPERKRAAEVVLPPRIASPPSSAPFLRRRDRGAGHCLRHQGTSSCQSATQHAQTELTVGGGRGGACWRGGWAPRRATSSGPRGARPAAGAAGGRGRHPRKGPGGAPKRAGRRRGGGGGSGKAARSRPGPPSWEELRGEERLLEFERAEAEVGEEDGDVNATVDLLRALKKHAPKIRLSFGCSTFVPEAHTRFRWYVPRARSPPRPGPPLARTLG